MNICIVGTGYVGLVTGACFAEMGNKVTCVDINEKKIKNLKNGILPIYEQGLDEIISKNLSEGRLEFTTSLSEATRDSHIHFIAVGTPQGEDGSADLQYVLSVAKELGKNIKGSHNIIVDKSTVPVGTADKVSNIIKKELQKREVDITFDVVSNPEFLKEGVAVKDFMKPDRIIIGTDSEKASKIMHDLYAPFTRNHDRILTMGIRDAEMTKYAANAMLATKISFMNEIACLCEEYKVDVENVRIGIGSDERIGYHFIYPGCGYGGSCFPKDVQALQKMATNVKLEPMVLNAVEKRNSLQKQSLFRKIIGHYGHDLSGKLFAIWGLAFKPGTDDMREAPSLVLINSLLEAGAIIHAHDPVAIATAKSEVESKWIKKNRILFFEHQYDVLSDADALIVVTEWKPFCNPDFEKIKRMLKSPVIFDGRNQYDPDTMFEYNLRYYGIGRGINKIS